MAGSLQGYVGILVLSDQFLKGSIPGSLTETLIFFLQVIAKPVLQPTFAKEQT
jgi:hypothetical protein